MAELKTKLNNASVEKFLNSVTNVEKTKRLLYHFRNDEKNYKIRT